MKHNVILELDKRGIKPRKIIEKYGLSSAGFYGTVAGFRKDRKTIKALKEEGFLEYLIEEFGDKYKDFAD